MRHLKHIIFITVILVMGAACSLLEGPQRVVLPTAIPTSPPLNLEQLSGEVVIDPVSDVVPGIDGDIQFLMNEVSTDQLTGYVQKMESFWTRNTYSSIDDEFRGVGAARRWLQSEFARVGNGRLLVQPEEFAINDSGIIYNQQNVVATLFGTSQHSGVVVLAAHYDSRTLDAFDGESFAPGANDNGSGVAVLLEVARLLSSREWNQTIVFVAFGAEEQGRNGSTHFVTNRMLDGFLFDAAINNDIVGGRPGIPQSLRLFAEGPDTTPMRQLARYMDLVSGLYMPQFPFTLEDAQDRPGRFSDHVSFLQVGVPAVRLTESQEDPNRQHNARDTSDGLDYNYLRQVTQLNLVVLANMIGAPPPPAAPAWAPMADPGAYILTWTPDPVAAGYAISFRPVGQDGYPPFRFVSGMEAGNVALTGLDPSVTYLVSLAAIGSNGRIGLFSPEIIIEPPR